MDITGLKLHLDIRIEGMEGWRSMFSELGRVDTMPLPIYKGHTRNHFSDFQGIKINRINTARIEKYITDRQLDGMNIPTLRKVLVTLNQIMAYAVWHGYMDYNPMRDAERPRGRGAVEDMPIRILSPNEINSLLDAVSDAKYNMLFMLAIMSGARQGELLGLKWKNVDWERIRFTFGVHKTIRLGTHRNPRVRSTGSISVFPR